MSLWGKKESAWRSRKERLLGVGGTREEKKRKPTHCRRKKRCRQRYCEKGKHGKIKKGGKRKGMSDERRGDKI